MRTLASQSATKRLDAKATKEELDTSAALEYLFVDAEI